MTIGFFDIFENKTRIDDRPPFSNVVVYRREYFALPFKKKKKKNRYNTSIGLNNIKTRKNLTKQAPPPSLMTLLSEF